MNPADNLQTASVQNLSTLNRDQRYRGVRTVASAAHDAEDCAQLLEVLGLDAADGRPPSEDSAAGSLPVAERRRIFVRGWLGYERS